METSKTNNEVRMIQYIRDHKRKPIGVMLAKSHDGKMNIGFSLCCKRDKFNKEFGKRLAEIRAELFINAKEVIVASSISTRNMRLNIINKPTIWKKNGILQDRNETVIIPQTIYHPLSMFISKCIYKYNGKYALPRWTNCLV